MDPLDHIALVVPRLEETLARLQLAPECVGPVESFPSEGTREVYLGQGAGKLLLLEPIGSDGTYARWVAKRGFGLHHVALHTADLSAMVQGLRGWLLHPKSLETHTRSRTVWLARPGVPALVELHESTPAGGPPLVEAVEIPAPLAGLDPQFGLSQSPDSRAWLTLDQRRVAVEDLVAGDDPE
ncbi:MAG: VOC family protein [Planctomycetota bacterium]